MSFEEDKTKERDKLIIITSGLDGMASNGRAVSLANLLVNLNTLAYRSTVELALQDSLGNSSIEELCALLKVDGVPEGVEADAIHILAKNDRRTEIAEKYIHTKSESVLAACTLALTKALDVLRSKEDVDQILEVRKAVAASEYMVSRCDDAIIDLINSYSDDNGHVRGWAEDARTESLSRLWDKTVSPAVYLVDGKEISIPVRLVDVSPTILLALATADKHLANIDEKTAAMAVRNLGYVGDIGFLACVLQETTSPSLKEMAEYSILNAMYIGETSGWVMGGFENGVQYMCWTGHEPYGRVLEIDCSEVMVKEVTKDILAKPRYLPESAIPVLEEDLRKRRDEHLPRIETNRRILTLYLDQQRRKNSDKDILSEGTVEAPRKSQVPSVPPNIHAIMSTILSRTPK